MQQQNKLRLTVLMPGMDRMVPITGIRRKKLMATGKNPLKQNIRSFYAITILRKMQSYLNKTTKPYISTIMPTSGHPMRTTTMPPKKAADPLALCHWKKKRNVRSKPITNARPARNKIWN